MRRILNIFSLIVAFCGVTSCSEDFLELKPLDQYDSESVWNGSDASLIESFINNIYLGLPDGFRGDRLITASYIDETMLVFNRNTSTVNQSLISPSAYYDFDNNEGTSDHYVWENAFKNI